MPAFRPPGPCPVCQTRVPAGSKACPQCGATAEDGWSEELGLEGADLPDTEFNYDEFVKREFGNTPDDAPRLQFDRKTLWWATAVVLLAALTFGYWWV